jgi:uncharacterized membrane protein (DUF485 family)
MCKPYVPAARGLPSNDTSSVKLIVVFSFAPLRQTFPWRFQPRHSISVIAMAADEQTTPDDPTPIVAAPTDVAPLSHQAPKPAHERTADEEAGAVDWEKLAASDRFRELIRAKRRFIVPAMIFFIVYYFALPVLIGYAKPFMERRVFGPVNLAYLFALSQFFMAWIIAALYVRAAARFDRMSGDVLSGKDDASSHS